MKDLALDDLHRLATEVGFTTGNPEEWAEKTDFPFDVLLGIGTSANQVVREKMMEAASQLIDLDLGALIRDACISAFVLGFEAHKEFGSASDDEQS